MFRHVVLFTWKEGTTREQQQRVADELRRLPGVIGQIRGYQVGLDAGLAPGNYQFAVVADFGTVDDYLVYRDHPVHRAIIAEHIQPLIASRAAVQYEI